MVRNNQALRRRAEGTPASDGCASGARHRLSGRAKAAGAARPRRDQETKTNRPGDQDQETERPIPRYQDEMARLRVEVFEDLGQAGQDVEHADDLQDGELVGGARQVAEQVKEELSILQVIEHAYL